MAEDAYCQYEVSDSYLPDTILKQLGFMTRVAFCAAKQCTFPYMFCTAHCYICNTYPDSPATKASLDRLSSARNRLLVVREPITAIISTIRSPSFSLPASAITLLPRYEQVMNEILRRADTNQETIVKAACETFGVHVVLLAHTEDSIEAFLGIGDFEGPMVCLEKYQDMYLMPEFAEEKVRILTGEGVRSMFGHLEKKELKSEDKTPDFSLELSAISGGVAKLVSKETQLQQLVSAQSAIISTLLPALNSSTHSFSKEVIELVHKSQRLSAQLSLEPSSSEGLTELERTLKSLKARDRVEHDWEHCEYHSEEIVELQCGHHLCKEHMEMGKKRCPWRCQA